MDDDLGLRSECGQAIRNRSQAIMHAAECCSVGVLGPEVCLCCGQEIPEDGRRRGAAVRARQCQRRASSANM